MILITSSLSDTKWGEPEDDHVTVLTQSNFQNFIERHPKVFVKFYAPWCGHCKAMAPAYSELAQEMKEADNGIPIAKVDATVEKELAEKYSIQGFPSLKMFMNGEAVDYNGERTKEAIAEWIKSKGESKLQNLTTIEQLETFQKESIGVIFLVDQTESDLVKKFETFSMNYEDVPFAYSHSQEVKDKFEITQKYGFVIVRDFDDGNKFLVVDELTDMTGLKSFFEAVRFPIVMKFDQKAAERIFGS